VGVHRAGLSEEKPVAKKLSVMFAYMNFLHKTNIIISIFSSQVSSQAYTYQKYNLGEGSGGRPLTGDVRPGHPLEPPLIY